MKISAEAFSDEALLRLADECIVPVLVDFFLRSRLSLPDAAGLAHNVHQL